MSLVGKHAGLDDADHMLPIQSGGIDRGDQPPYKVGLRSYVEALNGFLTPLVLERSWQGCWSMRSWESAHLQKNFCLDDELPGSHGPDLDPKGSALRKAEHDFQLFHQPSQQQDRSWQGTAF